jgi:hypothetical protein
MLSKHLENPGSKSVDVIFATEAHLFIQCFGE